MVAAHACLADLELENVLLFGDGHASSAGGENIARTNAIERMRVICNTSFAQYLRKCTIRQGGESQGNEHKNPEPLRHYVSIKT